MLFSCELLVRRAPFHSTLTLESIGGLQEKSTAPHSEAHSVQTKAHMRLMDSCPDDDDLIWTPMQSNFFSIVEVSDAHCVFSAGGATSHDLVRDFKVWKMTT